MTDGDRDLYVTDANGTLIVFRQVGWRSPKTGNLFRPGPGSQMDWPGADYEPVWAIDKAAADG